MQFTFTLTDKIDPVAVYAALVATMVFAWNVYVSRNSGPAQAGRRSQISGPRLHRTGAAGYDRGCRTVTIERGDGSVRRIRRGG